MKKSIIIISLFYALPLVSQVPSYLPTTGLVGWYSFSGNANDGSGSSLNGVVNGATPENDRFGNPNSAYSFDGASNNYIEIPDNALFQAQAATWSIWVKITVPSVGNGYGIMSKGNNLTSFFLIEEYQHTLGAQIVWQPGSGIGAQSNVDILDGNWHNLLATYDNSLSTDNFSVYLDGTLQKTETYNNTAFNLNNGLSIRIGRSLDPFWQSFTGLVDDIGIWNRKLNSNEITAIHQGCALAIQPISQTGIVGNSVQFIASSPAPNASYQWQSDVGFGFQNLSNAGQYVGTTNDTLTVSNLTLSNNNQAFRCLVSSDACKDTSNLANLTVTNSTGVGDILSQANFRLYPNPTGATLTIELGDELIGSGYFILDQVGSTVLKGNFLVATTTINLSELATGGYYLILEGHENEGVQIIKK